MYARPPAFQAVVVVVAGGSHTVSSDGSGTWRVDIDDTTELATGVSAIWSAADGGAAWDPRHEAWRPLPAGDPPPFPLQTEIAWASGGIPGSLTCPDWSEIGDEVVASRPAIRLHCGERDQDFWLDRETLLVLQVRAGAATPGWDNGAGISIAELRLGSLDPARFVALPVADRPEDWPTAVIVGQPIPAWSGVTLDGAPVGSGRKAGQPQVILVWASWCPPCFEDLLPFFRTAMGRTDVDVMTIAINDDPARVRAALVTAGLEVPTVVDDGTIQEAFGSYAVPLFIFVDGVGIVRAFAVVPVDPDVLVQAVDVLVAGGTPVLASPSP
jgi:cytochrome c biogenesis protein CcmG/thiol:disulfide interchange protein DsbE